MLREEEEHHRSSACFINTSIEAPHHHILTRPLPESTSSSRYTPANSQLTRDFDSQLFGGFISKVISGFTTN